MRDYLDEATAIPNLDRDPRQALPERKASPSSANSPMAGGVCDRSSTEEAVRRDGLRVAEGLALNTIIGLKTEGRPEAARIEHVDGSRSLRRVNQREAPTDHRDVASYC